MSDGEGDEEQHGQLVELQLWFQFINNVFYIPYSTIHPYVLLPCCVSVFCYCKWHWQTDHQEGDAEGQWQLHMCANHRQVIECICTRHPRWVEQTVLACEITATPIDQWNTLVYCTHPGEHPAAMQHNEARSWMRSVEYRSLIVILLLLIHHMLLLQSRWGD